MKVGKVLVVTYKVLWNVNPQIKIFDNDISAFEWARKWAKKEWHINLNTEKFFNGPFISASWVEVEQ